MFRQDTDQEDLKSEIYHLKKQNFNVQSENNILKVKVRKLKEECLKKDKQIYALLDPQKNIQVRKVVTDRGAHMLINLKEKNDKLEKALLEKDAIIRKLQNKLGTISSYFDPQQRRVGSGTSSTIPRCQTDVALVDHRVDNRLDVKMPQVSEEQKSDRSCYTASSKQEDGNNVYINKNGDDRISNITIPRTPEFSVISTTLLRQVKELQKGLHKADGGDNNKGRRVSSPMLGVYSTSPIDHLLTLMEEAGVGTAEGQVRPPGRAGGNRSPASDLDRAELLCETPHEEIQQLQQYFFSMLAEVDQLKVVIEKLQQDQLRTDAVLRTKDCSIKKLAEEVKSLKSKRTLTASTLGKTNKAKGYAQPRCYTAVKKIGSPHQSYRSCSKTTVSKASLSCTSEEDIVECPFYNKTCRKGKKGSKEGKQSSTAKPEVTKLWTRPPATATATSKTTEESVDIRMPMIEETTTPHTNSVASVPEEEEEEVVDETCKRSESL